MESSPRRRENDRKTRGIPLRAILASLALHAVLLGVVAPRWFAAVPAPMPAPRSAASLEARLLPVPGTAMPAPVHTIVHHRHEVSPPPAVAAVSPAPTFPVAPPDATPPPGASPSAGPREGSATASASAAPDADALRQFRLALAREARRLRRYPEAARREGLAGTVEVQVAVEADGAVRRASLERGSGDALLDATALEMLRVAAGRAELPAALRGRSFAVLLPVVFEMRD